MVALRILLVDDELQLLALLKRHLERCGYSVVACPTGELALEALQAPEYRPDVLIADEILPGMSGTALAGEVAARFPLVSCLICSGSPMSTATLPQSFRSRAAILQKPFMPAMLNSAIVNLVAANSLSEGRPAFHQ